MGLSQGVLGTYPFLRFLQSIGEWGLGSISHSRHPDFNSFRPLSFVGMTVCFPKCKPLEEILRVKHLFPAETLGWLKCQSFPAGGAILTLFPPYQEAPWIRWRPPVLHLHVLMCPACTLLPGLGLSASSPFHWSLKAKKFLFSTVFK